MAIDALNLELLVKEMSDALVGGKITKISQPEKDEIVLTVFRDVTRRVVISANAAVNRIHLTKYAPANPQAAPTFCMLLRKHILNATITAIVQQPYERLVDWHLSAHDELGYDRQFHLIFEMTGKTSNMFLADGEYKILDSIKHLPQDLDSARVLLSGGKYQYFPQQDKVEPFDSDGVRALLMGNMQPIRSVLAGNLLGVSKETVAEMTHGVDEYNHSDINIARVLDGIDKFRQSMANCRPNMVLVNGSAKGVYAFDYASVKGERMYFDTLCDAHDHFYQHKNEVQRFADKAKSVTTVVKNAIGRTEKKLAVQRQSVVDCAGCEQNRVFGDLILGNIHLIKATDTVARVVNYYDENGGLVDIPLTVGLSPQANAQRYYKKYAKQKSTIKHSAVLIEENEKKLAYLVSVAESLKYCTTAHDLEEIVGELVDVGLLKGKKGKVGRDNQTRTVRRGDDYGSRGGRLGCRVAKDAPRNDETKDHHPVRRSPASSPPLEGNYDTASRQNSPLGRGGWRPLPDGVVPLGDKYDNHSATGALVYDVDGFVVLVGKNNVQNDAVTFKMARAEDIWLHTQKIHSSHVVIVTQGREVPDDVVVVAAEICAYYSQARNGGKVAVDYCRRANVKRPHKAALGFVTYTGQRTVIVEACEHREMVRG